MVSITFLALGENRQHRQQKKGASCCDQARAIKWNENQMEAHEKAGFKLEELGLQSKRQRTADGKLMGASDLAPDPDWLAEQQRWYAEWNYDDKGTQTLSQQTADCMRRLRVGQKAPTWTPPAPLPKAMTEPGKAKSQIAMKWPYHPPMKLLMQAFMKTVREKNENFDVILSTAGLYALSGHPSYAKEMFTVEKAGKCLIVEHKPTATHDDLTTPMAKVKANCVKTPTTRHYMSFGKLTAGAFRLLLVSEVAASAADGKPLEVFTGSTPRMSPDDKRDMAMRLLAKGATSIKYVQVTANKIVSMHDDRPPADFRNSEAYLNAGKLARHNIGVMLDSVKLDGKPTKMTFVQGRPVFN
eukprot:TRINITY_DN3928_c0_g1_i1.p1 TRINITY_DN3928_c0_g1~~TRINITY_DN3928_c0_g1_i1.p1  ORF type:complete len:356 (-),score=69.97 TRINITY_DN3928_c0_g1_i1:118-1185(-)